MFINGTGENRKCIANQTIQACENDGFFYITNHGIEEELFVQRRNSALSFLTSTVNPHNSLIYKETQKYLGTTNAQILKDYVN